MPSGPLLLKASPHSLERMTWSYFLSSSRVHQSTLAGFICCKCASKRLRPTKSNKVPSSVTTPVSKNVTALSSPLMPHSPGSMPNLETWQMRLSHAPVVIAIRGRSPSLRFSEGA